MLNNELYNEIAWSETHKVRYLTKEGREVDGKLHIFALRFNNKLVLELKNDKLSIPIDFIKECNVTSIKKGFIRKKDDKMIVIKFYDEEPGDSNITINVLLLRLTNLQILNDLSITINVEDKNAGNILKTIETLKRLETNDVRNRVLDIQYMDNDTVKEVTIDPWSDNLYEGEEKIWFFEYSQKDARWYLITIFRIMVIDDSAREIVYVLPLQELDDVIVTNTYRSSSYSRSSVYTGYANRFFTGSSSGYTYGTSRTFGDVIFLKDGKPVITFVNIPDPRGLVRLIKSVKKQLYPKVSSCVMCKNCNNRNPKRSSFCNKCGYPLN